MSALLSAGIDIGTSTTQLVLSRLTIQNENGAFSVPSFAITEKEVVYRSAIHFTPLRSATEIDAAGVRAIVAGEYAAAGVRPGDIQTGAVIITGETARKENARAVLDALSGFAGDFVVATAGPALESVLAGKGAGAQQWSAEVHGPVLNLDIGGGTTNLALFEDGRLRDPGCLNVGGRLIKVEPDGLVTYVSPVLKDYVNFRAGQRVSLSQLEAVAALLAEVLEWALLGDTPRAYPDFITDKNVALEGLPLLSFSGGVADLIGPEPRPDLAYGDLGVLLGRAIHRSRLCRAGQYRRAAETIRATVIGAGSHSTELSGSTIFYQGMDFPMKNLPVAALSPAEEAQEPAALGRTIRSRLSMVAPEGPAVLGLQGRRNPKFSELCKLADGLAEGLAPRAGAGQPLIVAVEADMGKALGQALQMLLPGTPLLCLDGVRIPPESYLDIGAPVAGGQALPVVVKTLVL